ncbi:flagellar hook-associated protein FlgK [Cellulomonas persica]|uniref:Flagellar hook-associated protein 1 n=1 Tax=Cellulomonas persica TaxID=76861 RepID=A0A510UXC1_9CELL|nr:flagellar hook-associated protein FlgK [Cellulomonas persica]GEK19334.1 flagellar hook-associated protein 1 [Cellulomonas persica]
MSTFSGLGTALSSLIAQRQALDVAGQNVANANTVGYTRQRVTFSSVSAVQVPSMFSTNDGVGQGTRISSVDRLADVFLDAKLRVATSSSSYLTARAEAFSTLEKSLGEPGSTGLSTQLSDMWAAWQEVGNYPDKSSSRAVLLESSRAVTQRIGTLYSDVRTQWAQARQSTVALVDEVNGAAESIADLNGRIAAITASGATAHELEDQRDLLVTRLSSLVGAVADRREDGSVDVLVGGNALVRGPRVNTLSVAGATSFDQATATPGQAVTIVWTDRPTQDVALTGGRVAGLLSVLAPSDGTGSGGPLADTAARLDALATSIAAQVNALHGPALRADGTTGGDFFTFTAGLPPALGLTVRPTDPAEIAVGAVGGGALDGSVADLIGKLGTSPTGPDTQWSTVVVDLGVRAAGAASRAKVAEAARTTAEQQQVAQASVDTDEETVNMLAFQRAYEGAARVLTAIDEMLDTLINRTGVVGR